MSGTAFPSDEMEVYVFGQRKKERGKKGARRDRNRKKVSVLKLGMSERELPRVRIKMYIFYRCRQGRKKMDFKVKHKKISKIMSVMST